MQRIFASPWTPEEYITTEAYRQIIPESMCPSCLRAVRLHRHARYQRWLVTLMAKLLLLWIARFFCPLCKTTISYLPDFAFTYRPLQPQTFEAFLDGQVDRADVRSFAEALGRYRRRAEAFATELIRMVGVGLGRPPPRSLRGFWPWLKKASEGLRPLTRRLVTEFKINLFARYQCHQPVGSGSGSARVSSS